MANKKEKSNFRKYLNLCLLLVAIFLVCLMASKLYSVYEANKLKDSVLSRVVGTIQYDDVENATREMVSDDFIFISYVKSPEVRSLEKKLKKIIIEKELQNNFYYLNATDLMLEDDYVSDLNKKFNLKDTNKIKNLPALLYYKNGKFVKTITSDDKIFTSDEFSKLLDNYEIPGKE